MTTISGLGGVNYGALVQQAGGVQNAASQPKGLPEFPTAAPTKAGGGGGSPARGLDEALKALHQSHETADKAVLDLASGQEHNNIHNTMLALEEADIALKFTVQLRNRALAAYEELMRIQV